MRLSLNLSSVRSSLIEITTSAPPLLSLSVASADLPSLAISILVTGPTMVTGSAKAGVARPNPASIAAQTNSAFNLDFILILLVKKRISELHFESGIEVVGLGQRRERHHLPVDLGKLHRRADPVVAAGVLEVVVPGAELEEGLALQRRDGGVADLLDDIGFVD